MNGFKNYLDEIDWSIILSLEIDEGWNFFTETLHKGFEKFVPKTNPKTNKNQPCWLNKECMKLIRKKYHLYKRFTKSKLYYDYQKYIEIRNKTNKQLEKLLKSMKEK